MSHNVWKTFFARVSDQSRKVWSESSLDVFWIAKDAKFLHVDNEALITLQDAQADLSLHLVHMSEGTFSHIVYVRRYFFSRCGPNGFVC